MILDFQKFTDISSLDYDVCVVGTGPAAISIANSYLGTSIRVLLLESGGFDSERSISALYRGESVGYKLANGLEGSRSRYLGGSSNCWAGACTPLDDIDFRQRSWVPNSGWPIDPESLNPYVNDAQKVLLCGPYIYDARLLEKNIEDNLRFSPDTLELGFWQFSSEPRLGKYYKASFEASDNVTVLLHATVTNIETSLDVDHVNSLTIRSFGGSIGRIRAKFYVLACGGIENARLLLASNSVSPNGVGNSNGLVGRYFMEHPVAVCATVLPRYKNDARLNFLNVFHLPSPTYLNTRFNTLIKTSKSFQKRHEVLNSAFFLVDHDSEFSPGLLAAVRLRQALMERRIPEDLIFDLKKVLLDIRNVTRVAYGRYGNYGAARSRLGLKVQAETIPNRESKVTLSSQRDKFGSQLARLDWKISALDRRTVDVTIQEVARQFDILDLADLRLDGWMESDLESFPVDMRGGVHHTGTTRMSHLVGDGVVDINCRVHEVDNLYIAGSSVFPTNSWANPTWTISLLSLRLADHLREKLKLI